jgi:pyruvate oxidase
MVKFRCSVCNWIYDEDKEGKLFLSLPDSFHCPVCGSPKSAFFPEGVVKIDKKISTNVAEKIIEQLEAYGVKHIYGIPGDSNLPLIEAIRKSKKIKFVLTRHEETAAFMADAHGKITGHIGVCISIAGPGSTNLITGLIDAANDRSPVLALTGQVAELYLGSEAFQEIDQIELFQPFTVFSETISRTNQALKLVTSAVKKSYQKPGVSVLSTPTDVLVEKLDEKIFTPAKRLFKNPTEPKDEDIQKAAELIDSNKKIIIFGGWGARNATKEIMQLSKKLKAPIATTSRAKGIIRETEKYSVGVVGSIGAKHATQALQKSELIIIIGSGFRQANLVPANIKIIQIDHDSTRIGKTFNVDAGLVGDAQLTLKKLIQKTKEKNEEKDFLQNILKNKNQHLEEIREESKDLSIPINPGFVIQALKRNISRDAIVCTDVGDHTYWFYKKFICDGQKTFLSANIASMGFGLPAALSAKLDYPDKQVICLTGDGGFAMLMADFTTAVREKLSIKIILFNDGKLKNIKKEQLRDSYPEYGVSFPNPNFADFAKTAGGEGYRITNPKELDKTLKKAFNSNKPSIIEVIIDPEKLAAATK